MILSFGGTPSCSGVNISIPLSAAPEVDRAYLAVVKDEAESCGSRLERRESV